MFYFILLKLTLDIALHLKLIWLIYSILSLETLNFFFLSCFFICILQLRRLGHDYPLVSFSLFFTFLTWDWFSIGHCWILVPTQVCSRLVVVGHSLWSFCFTLFRGNLLTELHITGDVFFFLLAYLSSFVFWYFYLYKISILLIACFFH